MDQMQASSTMPHLVQVYQTPASTAKIHNPQIIHISQPSLTTSEGKVTYQQTITSKPLQLPLTHVPEMTQSQIVMSSHQTHLQNVQLQSQIAQPSLQSSEINHSLHVIIPQVPLFKQHMVVGEVPHQYYGHYDNYNKVVPKVELDTKVKKEKQIECKTVASKLEIEITPDDIRKRKRSLKPDPNSWACNIRKQKHQRGEAYISRRGKFVPERKVKTTKDCLQSCKYKCSGRINDTDREHIFKAFYSLNANEKRHFLLNTTERVQIKHKSPDEGHKRNHTFKYFFLVRAVRHTVCKNFYLGTLAISQKPVYNVHLGKSEMNIPKPDGRGLSEASAHALPSEVKDRVRNHIMSYSTEDSKPIKQFSKKKQYLDHNLSIKIMYNMYFEQCGKDNITPVKESMYRKILKEEFNIHFRKVKSEQQLCCKCKGVIKKKS